MQNIFGRDWKLTIAIYTFVIVAALFIYNYHFPSENNFVEVPSIISLLNPELYQKDFYVQEMLQFNPRFYYHCLIYFTAKLGLSFPVVYFLYYVLSFSSYLIGLYALGKLICKSRLSATVLAFLGLVAINGTIGDVHLFRTEPIPAIYAMGFTIWGIYFCFCRKWILGYLFFGLACLLQFLVGVLPGCLIAPLLILDTIRRNISLKTLGLSFLILGGMASLVYVPMIFLGTNTGAIDNANFIYIYGHIRHPHHIIFSTFDLRQWRNFLFFMIGGLLCIKSSDSLQPEDKVKLSLVIYASALALVIGYVFVELYPVAFVAKLQLARTTPFAQLMVLIGVSALVNELYKRGYTALTLLLLVTPTLVEGGILLFILSVSLSALESSNSAPRKGAKIITAIAVTGTLLIAWSDSPLATALNINNPLSRKIILFLVIAFPLLVEKFIKSYQRRMIVTSSIAICSCLVLILGLSNALPGKLPNLIQKRLTIYEVPKDSVTKMALRFRQLSSEDALVLTPPSLNNFRFYSQRSIVFGFKSFPYTEQGIQEWTNRMEAILGPVKPPVTFDNIDLLFRKRSSSELLDVAKKFGANYVLTRVDWHPDFKGLEVDQKDEWILYKIS